MKERASANIGTVKRHAEMFSLEVENQLWDSGTLGESNPDQLRNTVLFLIGLNIELECCLNYNLNTMIKVYNVWCIRKIVQPCTLSCQNN